MLKALNINKATRRGANLHGRLQGKEGEPLFQLDEGGEPKTRPV